MDVSTLKIAASITGLLLGANDLARPKQELNQRVSLAFTDGTGASQCDEVFLDTRTIAASGSDSLDLAGGLANAFGETITFAEIVAILVRAAPGNTNDVVVGGAGSNTFAGPFADAGDKIKVGPGGVFLIAAPGAAGIGGVTASTGDILQIANGGSGTSVTYDIVIVGRTA